MFDWIRKARGHKSLELEAKAAPTTGGGSKQLPEQPPPKVKAGAQSYPTYLTTTRPSDAPLPKPDRRLANKDVTTYRTGATTPAIIRDFTAASPDLSAALFNYLRVGITDNYTAFAQNPDGTFNPEATTLLQQVIGRMNVLPDYSLGFSATRSLRSTSEALAKELILTGAMSCELVLDKLRLPTMLQPISTTTITFKQDKGGLSPIQILGGQQISLDVPTFFYVALDQDLLNAYADSMLEPAIKAAIFAEDFVKDLQRVAKRAVHPRLYIKLVEDQFRKFAPPEATASSDGMATYLKTIIETVQTTVDNLAPDDALVMFDSIETDYMNNGNISIGDEWKTLQDIVNAKLATGAKTMPAILGHGAGSQNVASTESMLFVKAASGVVRAKLNEIYSRIFTLAVRLFGYDVMVSFEYDSIDLRPDSELEAFRQTKQARILELLSLGLITDEEASLRLTSKLPPKGYKPLSGTMFKSKQEQGNSNPNGESNSGSTLNQKTSPSTPTQGRGQNNKSNPQSVSADVVDLQSVRN